MRAAVDIRHSDESCDDRARSLPIRPSVRAEKSSTSFHRQPECADLDKIVATTIAERPTLERARTGTSVAAGRPRGTTVHLASIDSVESITLAQETRGDVHLVDR